MRSSSARSRRSLAICCSFARAAPVDQSGQRLGAASSKTRSASRATSRSVRSARSKALCACARRLWRRRRVRSTTSPAPAPAPTITAAAGRTAARGQLRGSRIADSSQASSSSAAISTSSPRRLSIRSASSSGGSIGASAAFRRASMSNGWLTRSPRAGLGLLVELLELPDGAVQQHLGGAVRAAERASDLAVVHPEREAHDQRLAAVVREPLHTLEDSLEVVAILHQPLGGVRGRERSRVVDRRLRASRAVAVVVRREVVGDADQPRPQRPALRLALRPLEVPVGLKERLLREVLGVVVVAHPVVRVRVDVAQMGAVERREVVVEAPLGGVLAGSLRLCRHASLTLPPAEARRPSPCPLACAAWAP